MEKASKNNVVFRYKLWNANGKLIGQNKSQPNSNTLIRQKTATRAIYKNMSFFKAFQRKIITSKQHPPLPLSSWSPLSYLFHIEPKKPDPNGFFNWIFTQILPSFNFFQAQPGLPFLVFFLYFLVFFLSWVLVIRWFFFFCWGCFRFDAEIWIFSWKMIFLITNQLLNLSTINRVRAVGFLFWITFKF